MKFFGISSRKPSVKIDKYMRSMILSNINPVLSPSCKKLKFEFGQEMLPIWKCISASPKIMRLIIMMLIMRILIMMLDHGNDHSVAEEDFPNFDTALHHSSSSKSSSSGLCRSSVAVSRPVIVLWSRCLCLSNYQPTPTFLQLPELFSVQSFFTLFLSLQTGLAKKNHSNMLYTNQVEPKGSKNIKKFTIKQIR